MKESEKKLTARVLLLLDQHPSLALHPMTESVPQALRVKGRSYFRRKSSGLPVFWDWLRAPDGSVLGICGTWGADKSSEEWKQVNRLSYCDYEEGHLKIWFLNRRDGAGDHAQFQDMGLYRTPEGKVALLFSLFPEEERRIRSLSSLLIGSSDVVSF
jgi:hypothetical protein